MHVIIMFLIWVILQTTSRVSGQVAPAISTTSETGGTISGMLVVKGETWIYVKTEKDKPATRYVTSGDMMVVADQGSVVNTYKISPENATQVWKNNYCSGSESPLIYKGHVYIFSGGHGSVLNLETGKLLSQAPNAAAYTSPIVADGKIFQLTNHALVMLRATPENCTQLGKVALPVERFTSPSYADGKLYVRLEKGKVACFDLTAGANAHTSN